MRVYLGGVRGSTPAPGADFVRYGGNTSCLALTHDGADIPTLILDAGTGLRRVTSQLGGGAFVGTIVLTHLHWDHHQGIPFFSGGDRTDSKIRLLLPDQEDGSDAEAVLARGMSPPHFPIRPGQLNGNWSFETIRPGRSELEGFEIEVREVPHKGGRTFGYRVTDGHSSITYIPDHCPTDLGPGPDGWGDYHDAAIELAEGSDLVVHDAHLLPEELARDAYLGHSVPDYAIGLARRAEASAVLLFHHRPDRTDAALDEIASRYSSSTPVATVAAEGSTIDL